MAYVPFLYSYLAAKLMEHYPKKQLKIWEFRLSTAQFLKVKKNNSLIILRELEKFGLIEYDKETETIRII